MLKMQNNTVLKCTVIALTIYAICLTYVVFCPNDRHLSVEDEIVCPCNERKNTQDANFIMELQRNIIQHGDTAAYNYLILNYGDNLVYSIFMADKYGYPNACYNVYSALESIYLSYGISPDSIATNLSLSCLYRGKDDKECNMALGMLHTIGFIVEKDTIKGRKYTEKAFKKEGKEKIDIIMKLYQTNPIYSISNKKHY